MGRLPLPHSFQLPPSTTRIPIASLFLVLVACLQKRATVQLALSPVDAATIDFEQEEVKISAIRRLIVQVPHCEAEGKKVACKTNGSE